MNDQFHGPLAGAGDSHDGRGDEGPRGPDEADCEHGEADIPGLVDVTS